MHLVKFFFSFEGRIGRAQFWLTQLLELVLFFGAAIVLSTVAKALGAAYVHSAIFDVGLFAVLAVCIAMFLASSVRRWHDLGRTGWWQLLALLPFGIGVLLILYVCGIVRGDEGPNAYGPPPRLWAAL